MASNVWVLSEEIYLLFESHLRRILLTFAYAVEMAGETVSICLLLVTMMIE
jgi:hypothetical protein